MNKEFINNYKDWKIIKEKLDKKTAELIKDINKWFHKVLSPNFWINMKKWTFHVINWFGLYLTNKGFIYIQKIIKKRRLTYWIKWLIENEKWNELDEIFNLNDKLNKKYKLKKEGKINSFL